jgi:Family of unknown function (DUF6282)
MESAMKPVSPRFVLADQILQGAIDLHHHGYPEITFDVRTRHEDVEEYRHARDAGMAGIVLKSHMWPTVGRAYLLQAAVPGIEVIPSLTMNTIAGGFNPISVESAARQGARVLFMPTWSAANDLERSGGFSSHLAKYLAQAGKMKSEAGLRVAGPDGKVLPEVRECLAVAGQYGMLVCTAHISPTESIALADCAKNYGIDEVVFSHPDSESVGATREQIRDMAQLGAIAEFCVMGALPAFQHLGAGKMLDILGDVGAGKAIITTDYFFDWFPPGAEAMRLMIGTCLQAGISAADVTKMVRTNPERLLARSRTLNPTEALVG